jgi:arylsulfatase A-like enzyme
MGTGTHRPNGVFMGLGAGIKKAARIAPMKIQDVTPTIMYLMGLPVPDDMDGQAPRQLFREDFVKGNRLEYTEAESVKPGPPGSGGQDIYTEEEEQALRDQLKNLGYME